MDPRQPSRPIRRAASNSRLSLVLALCGLVFFVAGAVVYLKHRDRAAASPVTKNGDPKPIYSSKPCRECAGSGRVDSKAEAIRNEVYRLDQQEEWKGHEEHLTEFLRDAGKAKWHPQIREAVAKKSLDPLPMDMRSELNLKATLEAQYGRRDGPLFKTEKDMAVALSGGRRAFLTKAIEWGHVPLPDSAWKCTGGEGAGKEPDRQAMWKEWMESRSR